MTPIPLGILALSGLFSSGAFDLLETTTLATSASSVTFTGLGAYDYKHLQIRMVARGDRASTLADVRLRFNSDSGSNYADHQLRGNGASVSSAAQPSKTNIFCGSATGATFTASAFAGNVIDILDFSSTSKNTTVRSLGGMAGTNNQILLFSGLWNSTAAVTSIQLLPEVNDFVSGSRFSLIGIR
jgi:hypothetical protein